tara:strand:- start:271 stop:456 length:186 start_codon:yes stop_codon:yes gene_type:complete
MPVLHILGYTFLNLHNQHQIEHKHIHLQHNYIQTYLQQALVLAKQAQALEYIQEKVLLAQE